MCTYKPINLCRKMEFKSFYKFVLIFQLLLIKNEIWAQNVCDNAPVLPNSQNEITMKVYYQAQTDNVMSQICADGPKFKNLNIIFYPSNFGMSSINEADREQACASVYVAADKLPAYACCRVDDNKSTTECAELVGADEAKITACAAGNDSSVNADEILTTNGAAYSNLPFYLPNDANAPVMFFNDIPDYCTMVNIANNFNLTVCLMFNEKNDQQIYATQ